MICVGIRIFGIRNETEPLPRGMFFCGVFLGFTIVSVFFFVIVCCRICKVSYVAEAAVSTMGFIAFATCGFLAMYHVEKHTHLIDKKGWYHKLFILSRLESIFSMQSAGLFLVHGVLVLDIMGCMDKLFGSIHSRASQMSIEGRDKHAYERLRLNPFWRPPFEKLSTICCHSCERVPEEAN